MGGGGGTGQPRPEMGAGKSQRHKQWDMYFIKKGSELPYYYQILLIE